jgi:RNA polymerase sigma-70 factor (ECF subfamily)
VSLGRGPLSNPEQLLQRVYAYVAYRLGDRFEAEDITIETFERALRQRGSFDARRGSTIAWLLGIARNCIYDAKLRQRPILRDPDEAAGGGPKEPVVQKLALGEALASLVDRDRELLALRYGADLEPKEVAALLDMRASAVDVALSRARARLADALEHAERSAWREGSPELADVTDPRSP